MDNKNKNKRSIWENLKNPPCGYSIEFGDTTYKNTLDERIQAAKNASLIAKQAQKQKHSEKCFLTYSEITDIKKNPNCQTMTVKTIKNCAQDFKNKNRPHLLSSLKSVNDPTINVFPFKSATTKNININVQTKFNANDLLPTFKGGLMQRRLEAIKANKKESKTISLKCDKKILESTKSNDSSNSQFPQKKHCNTINSKRNEYKLRSTVQKNTYNEINCNCTKNITSTSTCTSVQNRLIKAKEEMKTKSKFHNQIDVPKTEIKKNPSLGSIHQDTNAVVHNVKNKIKRLNQSTLGIKKKIPAIVSTAKKIISNTSEVNKMANKQLITVQQKPLVQKKTVRPTKLANPNILNKSKQNELDSFSFIISEPISAQRRLENIKKKTQCNETDSMEWEVINEPNTIVNQVNDLRRTPRDYEDEPMEWIPDSILHCDQIDHCLVIDTNIYLSNLNLITIILDKHIHDYGYITIVLPWQVLQELDCMKKNETSIGYQAREVTRWLLEMFSNSHPRLKGEPMVEKHGLSPDDAILKCAINLKDRVNHIYLVTDDKMLMVKSKVNKVCTKDSEWLKSIVSVKSENCFNIFQGSFPT